MKITKRQLRRIIREEKARILAEQKLDPQIAAEALAELKEADAFDTIQNEATTAATIIANLSSDMDIPLMDAGPNELALDLRKAEELLDKIRDAAFDLR
jgi:hypothetical protein